MAKLFITGATVQRAAVGAVAVAVGLFGSSSGSAQSTGSVTVEVGECVDLKSPDERLACYERRVEAAKHERPVAPAAAAPAAEVEPPIADSRRSAATRDAAEPPDIIARVAELRETLPNSYLITLDNGQVWRQMRPKRYPLQPGYKVRIYPTVWGSSYRLAAEELNSFIQVERAR